MIPEIRYIHIELRSDNSIHMQAKGIPKMFCIGILEAQKNAIINALEFNFKNTAKKNRKKPLDKRK